MARCSKALAEELDTHVGSHSLVLFVLPVAVSGHSNGPFPSLPFHDDDKDEHGQQRLG